MGGGGEEALRHTLVLLSVQQPERGTAEPVMMEANTPRLLSPWSPNTRVLRGRKAPGGDI